MNRAVANEPDDARRAALQWALDVGRTRLAHLRAGETVPAELEADYVRADAMVLSALRAKLGFAELKWAISGAAPIAPDTLAFFAALGVPISEIWGMSELTCIASTAPAEPTKLGTVGKLLPGMEMRIEADGELLVRGPLGHEGVPRRTGKNGRSDQCRRLAFDRRCRHGRRRRIPHGDRSQEGADHQWRRERTCPPAAIETAVKTSSSLIGEVVAIGDGRKFNTALITLSADAAVGAARSLGLAAEAAVLAKDARIVDIVATAVAEGNSRLSRAEQIKRFHVLTTFWEPGGDELTPTMKLRRKPIAEKYASEIAALYADSVVEDVYEPAPCA